MDEISRLERMFKELSDFSSQNELKLERADLKEIIDGILEVMREDCLAKKINLQYKIDKGVYDMRCDAERLRQVFVNLLLNAVNAMPEGGALTVSLRQLSLHGLKQPTHVEVSIKDTGKGIAPENLEKISAIFAGENVEATIIGKFTDDKKLTLKYKGEQGAKEAGKLRLEGKDYIVQDGDVMHFRFNV